MELNIRSQDKMILKKYVGVRIILDSYASIVDEEKNYILGRYETKGRALEVLDEIQNIIKPKAILQAKPLLSLEDIKKIQEDYDMKVLPNCVDVIEPISTSIVYEMPKE